MNLVCDVHSCSAFRRDCELEKFASTLRNSQRLFFKQFTEVLFDLAVWLLVPNGRIVAVLQAVWSSHEVASVSYDASAFHATGSQLVRPNIVYPNSAVISSQTDKRSQSGVAATARGAATFEEANSCAAIKA